MKDLMSKVLHSLCLSRHNQTCTMAAACQSACAADRGAVCPQVIKQPFTCGRKEMQTGGKRRLRPSGSAADPPAQPVLTSRLNDGLSGKRAQRTDGVRGHTGTRQVDT